MSEFAETMGIFGHVSIDVRALAGLLSKYDNDASLSIEKTKESVMMDNSEGEYKLDMKREGEKNLQDHVPQCGNGEIDFIEFLGMMVSENPVIQKDIKSHIVGFREAFNLFDATGRGHVTSREFYRAWNAFGFTATEEEIESMLKIADTDGSGELEYDEFVLMVAGAKTSLTDQIRGQLAEMREVDTPSLSFILILTSTLT